MLPCQQQKIIHAIFNALAKFNLNINIKHIYLDETKTRLHGDIACNIAMKIAGRKFNPRSIATQIIEVLHHDSDVANLIEKCEIAGAGFINIFLTQNAKIQVITEILRDTSTFGYKNTSGKNIILEFVSANPTGPLHVGHGRQAALGDCLVNILKTQGHKVYKEFYYNDAGVQIETLTNSVYMRAKGFSPTSPKWPQNAYNGEYITDIAHAFIHKKSVDVKDLGTITASGDIENLEDIRQFAVAYLRKEQDIDLKIFGVEFDNYYLESSLYKEGKVEQVVQKLCDRGHTYIQNDAEKGEALYLKTTPYGDDKDRVMRKSDGHYTYFVPDIAYHVTKFKRGFTEAINIQGFDHHGTIIRVKAGLQALEMGISGNFPQYILHKMVTVIKNGEEVKISKRAGSYVTLRDLIEWSGKTDNEEIDMQKGKDAVRFFLISRKADTEFVFDIDMALKQNEENPVYYIQYAHARISSILNNVAKNSEPINSLLEHNNLNNVLCLLTEEQELALLNKLAWYPQMLQQASIEMTPHSIAFFLRDIASLFHSFYSHCKVLVEDNNLKQARLLLLLATKYIISNGLNLLGVSAPEQM
jgi:arginyl-tRNA synthetase